MALSTAFESLQISADKQIAVVTGVGGKGIGRGITDELIKQGWFVFGCDIKPDISALNDLYSPKSGHFITLDVSDADAMNTWAENICTKAGLPRLIIANAGVLIPSTIQNVKTSDFEKMVNSNFKGGFFTARAFLQYLTKKDEKQTEVTRAFIGVSSTLGRIHAPKVGAYSATKWGLEGLFGVLAKELENTNIMSCTWDPCCLLTDMTRGACTKPDGWVDYQEGGKAAASQFIEFLEDIKKYNGTQQSTTFKDDERVAFAGSELFAAMSGAP